MSLFNTHYEYHLDEQGLTRGVTITTHCPNYRMLADLVELYELDDRYGDVYHGEGVAIVTREPIV